MQDYITSFIYLAVLNSFKQKHEGIDWHANKRTHPIFFFIPSMLIIRQETYKKKTQLVGGSSGTPQGASSVLHKFSIFNSNSPLPIVSGSRGALEGTNQSLPERLENSFCQTENNKNNFSRRKHFYLVHISNGCRKQKARLRLTQKQNEFVFPFPVTFVIYIYI